MTNIIELLNKYNLIEQYTPNITDKKYTFYVGFDPTADSLHLGHLLLLRVIKLLKDDGHTPIIVLGGGTALIGDPTGKTSGRKLLDRDIIKYNTKKLEVQIEYILKDNNIEILDNFEWLDDLDYLWALTTICKYFNVNTMIHSRTYAERLKEGGLSLLELNYQVLQAYDFKELNYYHNVDLQIGGDDQWSNMLAGKQFIKDTLEWDVSCLTIPLLTTSNGKKLGKTEEGTIWLNKDKTSPFELYQYIINLKDESVEKLAIYFLDDYNYTSDIINLKKTVAYFIVDMVHGTEYADDSLIKSNKLFNKYLNNITDDIITVLKLPDEILLVDLLESLTNKSKSEIRRLIEQKAVKINDVLVEDNNYIIKFNNEVIKLSTGKKFIIYIKKE